MAKINVGSDYHLGTGVRRASNFQSDYTHDIFMKKAADPRDSDCQERHSLHLIPQQLAMFFHPLGVQ